MHLLLLVVALSFGAAVLQRPRASKASEPKTWADATDWPLPSSRTYPCRVCSQHICHRDHHCVWINQCVGAHNHRAFIGFLVSFTLLTLLYAAAITSALAIRAQQSVTDYLVFLLHVRQLPQPLAGALYAMIGGFCTLSLAITQVRNIFTGLTTHEIKHLARAGWFACGSQKNCNGQHGQQLLQKHPFDHGGCRANLVAWWHAGMHAKDNDAISGIPFNEGSACSVRKMPQEHRTRNFQDSKEDLKFKYAV